MPDSMTRTTIAEVAPGIHRISSYHEPWRSSINGYLLGTKITNVEQRESFERYLDSVSGSSLSRHPTSDV